MIIESVAETNMMCREDLERNLATSSIVLSNDHTMSIHTFAQNQLSRNTVCSTAAPSTNNNTEFLFGIVFVQDGWNTELKLSEVPIGTIILEDWFELNAKNLRAKIIKSCQFDMNEQFIFLTNFGSPVSIEQEPMIKINNLATAERTIKFKRKLGINSLSLIGYYSNNCGIFIGLLNVSLSSDLKTTRSLIDDHLRKSTMKNFQFDSDYYFMVHPSYCIINTNNEPDMILIDIIRNNCISIKFDKPSPRNSDSIYLTNQDKSELKKSVDVNPSSNTEDQVDQKPILKGLYRRKTSKFLKTVKYANKKQIMISYVRREAAEHALQLKQSLIESGFSVYLDVHEIQHGSDWQDSLNSAIQNCLYFIPLITQNYGRTQWTNREVKLADILQKHIIPVNFLDFWPPECLAIQFSSVHYIPWNSKASEHKSGNPEIDTTDDNNHSGKTPHCIEDVTALITEKINQIKSQISAYPSFSQNSVELRSKSSENGQKDSESLEQQKNLIVISAHPAQIDATQKIKEFLSKHFDVWCTNEMTEEIVAFEQKNESANPSTSSMLGGESIELITSPTKHYARQIAEKSKKRPQSMPNSEKLQIKKKDLVRVQTYGDSPCFPSISPEKKERLKLFETQASKASLIIILASDQYYKSKTSEEHVFYSGQRKKVILVQYDESSPPVSISRQITLDNHLNYSSSTFETDLLGRIKRDLDPTIKSVENFHDHKITWLVDLGIRSLDNLETCVYILGSTETADLDIRIVKICEAIGKGLAKIPNLTIVTNNSFGASDIVAHRFYKELGSKSVDQNGHSKIIHIASDKEEKKTYGHTLILPGLTPKDKDPVIAKMLDTSVLIGGDQNSAREVEDIIWNDHFVIPIKSTGGAAGGEYNVPKKIFTCPNGVKETDWSILLQTDPMPEDVAGALVTVILDLKKAIFKHVTYQNPTDLPESLTYVPLKKRIANRRNYRNLAKTEEDKMDAGSIGDVPIIHEKYLPTYQQCSSSSSSLSSAPLELGHSPNIMSSDEMDGKNGKKNSFFHNFRKFYKRVTKFN